MITKQDIIDVGLEDHIGFSHSQEKYKKYFFSCNHGNWRLHKHTDQGGTVIVKKKITLMDLRRASLFAEPFDKLYEMEYVPDYSTLKRNGNSVAYVCYPKKNTLLPDCKNIKSMVYDFETEEAAKQYFNELLLFIR